MMNTLPSVNTDELRTAIALGLPVVALVTSPTCGHCRTAKTLLEAAIAPAYEGKVTFVQIDTIQPPDLVNRLVPGLRAVPSHLFLVDRAIKGRPDGAGPVPEVRKWIDSLLAPPA